MIAIKRIVSPAFVAILSLATLALNIAAQIPLTVRQIMAEPSIAGMRPEGQKISPDGRWVAFTWNAQGVEPRDLYVVATEGGTPKLLVSATAIATPEPATTTGPPKDASQLAREKTISNLDWSTDSTQLVFSQKGDLYLVKANGGTSPPIRITRTDATEAGARWLDAKRVLYQSNGNYFVLRVDQPGLVQITKEGTTPNNPAGGTSIGSVTPTEDGQSLAYVATDTTKQKALIVPNYLGDYVTGPTFRRGWSDQTVHIVKTDGSTAKPVSAKLPAAEGSYYVRGLRWTNDGSLLIVDRVDRDTKRRQLFRVNPADGTATLINEETDSKWIAGLSRIVEPSPKGDRLLFGSERDGSNHLYVISLVPGKDAAPAPVQQLTRGNWEVNWANWLPDGEQILYSSTEGSTTGRTITVMDLRRNNSYPLFDQVGMNTSPELAHDGEYLLYEHSEWNLPTELYAMRVCTNCRGVSSARRLTESIPAGFSQIKWAKPEFTEFAAKDGKKVKTRIYTPTGFDRSKKYPAVVFVHGAGYLQNVINGWNGYYREAMFNTMLTQHGYVVLDIDYRGSAGYGRDWRTDVYDFLGGLDLQDHFDGIDFLVKNYAVDKNRVGMYGGSYGGFMAEMAAMRAPEYIACAAALRPVGDWKLYFASSPVYTTERLGYPDKNPEAYKRSSPISYADKLDRPLLILHGMVDDNVHVQDSMKLVQKLIELGKTDKFEAMFYPSENHGFTRPESWTDEYQRVFNFFEKHLK